MRLIRPIADITDVRLRAKDYWFREITEPKMYIVSVLFTPVVGPILCLATFELVCARVGSDIIPL